MSSCRKQLACAVPTVGTICPASRTKGASVDLQTVKALLTTTALQRLQPRAHYFCPHSACDIVYYDEQGHTFSQTDIRVAVWQKQPEGSRVICYCFGENETDIREEIAMSGYSLAAERVRTHIRAGRCACDVRHPRGTCCLGDVRAAVKRSIAAAPTPAEVI
jgi:hypothetical protein